MAVCKRVTAPSGVHAAMTGHRVFGMAAALAMSLIVVPVGPHGTALAQKAMVQDCGMAVEQTWLGDLVASAIATGDCGLATLDLVVHNGVDEVVWSASYGSADLLGFDDILEPDAMRFAMEDWLGFYADNTRSGTLPEWPHGMDQPDAGEFPFYVEEGLSQRDYQELRASDYPMVCYIQGRESTLCLVQHPGVSALISVGAQSFPG
ncbi:MAG: hypothetical protein ABJN75_14510 [Hoeflea sp.]|uniref:hypothetical protein n=1 Tax=Hoeflea sp. TaxID=1940281 RepID=UPI003299B8A6